ncbi:MAG: IPT/TIG domain-containing protein [Acidobacteriota bacterium]|nr:IPT/TIG domain-containing protein [Acidobacteriota bacterium]
MPADIVTTVVGDGAHAYTANGVGASAALLGDPLTAAVDPAGDIVVPDQNDNVIRAVAGSTGTAYGLAMTKGDIYTIAGTGVGGFGGDGGPARAAELWGPSGVALDGAGDVAITDTINDEVRFLPHATGVYFGVYMVSGNIYDVAGDNQDGYFGDGGQATAAMLSGPDGVTFDAQGNLVFADTNNDVIRLVVQNTGTDFGHSVVEGDIYTIAGNGTFGYSGNGGPATAAALDLEPLSGVAVDGAGNLVMADGINNVIRVVAGSAGTYYGIAMQTGDIYTIAGNPTGGYSGDRHPAAAAEMADPMGVAVDSSGDILVADSTNSVIRMIAAFTGVYDHMRVRAGDIYTVVGDAAAPGYGGDGGKPRRASLNGPTGVSVTPTGELLVADNGNNVIRRVGPPEPVVTELLPGSGTSAGDARVVIKGRDLRGATSVVFGSTPATSFVVKSATKIIARSPAEPAGTVAVVVTSPAGSSQGSYTFTG